MKRTISLILGALVLSALIGACGGGGGGGAAPTPPPPPPPPPPAAQDAGGVWDGQNVSVAAADVFESFEFNATGGFVRGTTPYRATYSNGNAETRGVPAFYISGVNAWHILSGTSATVTFETLPNTLTFFVRTENAADVSNIDIFDADGALIQNVVPTNVYQPLNAPISVVRGAGQTLIGSVVVTSTSGGDVVIDDLTIGYSGSGFAGATDDIDCAVADTLEFACILRDTVTGVAVATVGGTVQVTNNTDVSGSGTLYAVPGSVLADGKTFANVTISAGTVSEANTLDLTVEAAGTTSTVSTTYDVIYERASDLATIGAVYTTFDIFGEMSSFTIDAAGVISGQSVNCMLNGQVTIIDAAFNVYDVSVTVTNTAACAVGAGTYNGLGSSVDDTVMDDAFVFSAFTADMAIAGQAVK